MADSDRSEVEAREPPGRDALDPLLPAARPTANGAEPAVVADPEPRNWFGPQRSDDEIVSVRRSRSSSSSSSSSSSRTGGRGSRRTGRSSSSKKRRRQANARMQVYVIAGAAAVIAAFAPGASTGIAIWDATLRMAFAFGVTVACSQARRWTWMVMAGLAAGASRDLVAVAMAWTALVLSFLSAVIDIRKRRIGAIIGALAVNALLRLEPLGFHGMTLLLGAIAVVPALVSAYQAQRRSNRRRILIGTGCVAGFAIVAIGALGAVGFVGAKHVGAATDAAEKGLDFAKQGEQDESAEQFIEARQEFVEAEGLLKGWFVQPSRLVPIVAYQTDALGRMASIGRDLAGTAEQVTATADYRRISVVDGRIDVAEISEWSKPLGNVEAALTRADSRGGDIQTDWLVPPIRDRYADLDTQVTDAIDEVSVAREAVTVAPDLLGSNGVRRYFIAFTTPAESRGLGGFVGNWAILEANNGKLDLTETGRSSDLAPQAGEAPRVLRASADYTTRYGSLSPETQLRDVTVSPDFPSVAQVISGTYPQSVNGTKVDGVLAVDPYALAAMLQITGPVKVEGLDFELTSENAADYLLREQYLAFGATELNDERRDVLKAASEATFDAFISQRSFRPSQLASVLGPVVAERRLVGYAAQPVEEKLIKRIGLDGSFPVAGPGDFMTLVTQNGGNNKMDIYLHRSISYDAQVDPETGKLTATATITLRNDAPSTGLPRYVIGNRASSGQPDGVNWLWFNFYTPHLLTSATFDGKPLSVGEQTEFGQRVYQTYLAVPSGGEAVIVLQLDGSIDPSSTYQLDWFQQPTVNTDKVDVTVRAVDPGDQPGSAVATSEPVTVTREERTDQEVTVELGSPL